MFSNISQNPSPNYNGNQNPNSNLYTFNGQNQMTQNLNIQRSSNEAFMVLRHIQSLTSCETLVQYQHLLSRQAEFSKIDLTREISKQQEVIRGIRKVDAQKMNAVRNRCQQAKRKNDQLVKKVLALQDLITRVAGQESRLQYNQKSIERENQLYKSIGETKRYLVEIGKRVYDIKTQETIVEEEVQPITIDLKEMEKGLQVLSMDVIKDRTELDVIKGLLSKK